MPEEDNNILKYNQDKKYLKALFVIYVATELLLEKLRSFDNSLEEFYNVHAIAVRTTTNFTAVLTS